MSASAGGPATVLVHLVDDDEPVRVATARFLRASGYEVRTYASAEEFLAATPHAGEACLLLDVKLGGMSGIDLQRRLRALGSSLAVIILTAIDDDGVREEAHQLGCAAFLAKDADAELLLGLIRAIESSTRPGTGPTGQAPGPIAPTRSCSPPRST